ncbi:solute carrier family 17 member 9-like isoform X1 [Anarrhichthys ocellatus]|uniref:solute carrier family 17 member 9-like isoform X1 n=1 Tax=Anarrhichthys ocellatus TaxID=433405 RepID=UPI0012ED056B|nr:solute carrier family 17 member 9-like isoform X1 [Anarrhichthys ocellatus]
MADTSGDGREDFNGSPLVVKVYTANGLTRETTKYQNLWPRPLARKWILMLFIGSCLLYCSRMAMPICAVSMATSFHWSKIDSGLVLGGFFWGYCFTQILGGHASDEVGGERVLFISSVLWALVTAGTPLLAHLGSHTLALMALARFLMGVLQGVFFPSLASLCSQHVVEEERGFLMSTMSSGSNLGILLAGGLGSLMLDRYGWESMFYSIGFLSGLWALIFWLCLIKGLEVAPKQMETSNDTQWSLSRTRLLSLFKKPPVWYSLHPLILHSLPIQDCLSFQPNPISTSVFVIFFLRAMMFTHMCASSTSYTLLSWLPTYFKESFPDAMESVYNVIPWLVAIPSALAGGCISGALINQGYSVGLVRKIMQFFAMGVSSVFIMLLSGAVPFTSAVIFVSAAIGLSTFSSSGVSVNVQDLCPSCAGAIYGFMNMLGAFIGLVLVFVSGYLIEVTLSWTTVFSLLTLVNGTGLGVFLIFGEGRRVDLYDYKKVTLI